MGSPISGKQAGSSSSSASVSAASSSSSPSSASSYCDLGLLPLLLLASVAVECPAEAVRVAVRSGLCCCIPFSPQTHLHTVYDITV